MSDEKRQTRLLPFRVRRPGGARRGVRPGFDDAEDLSADAELTALLRAWDVPAPTPGARERLLADFRASSPRPALWRRALSAEIRLPLPVAACAALVLLVSLSALATRPPAAAPAPGVAATEPAVRVVEVPVVEERVVTRTVHVGKPERAAVRSAHAPSRARQELAAGGGAARGAEAKGSAAGVAEAREPAEPPRVDDASGGYFTRVDMEDFQPADRMKIRVVSRGGVDEK